MAKPIQLKDIPKTINQNAKPPSLADRFNQPQYPFSYSNGIYYRSFFALDPNSAAKTTQAMF